MPIEGAVLFELHKLCATFSPSANINYRLPIKVYYRMCSLRHIPPPRGCVGGRIGTRFLRPRGTSPLKGANPAGTPGYRNGTESFFGLKGHPSVVRDV